MLIDLNLGLKTLFKETGMLQFKNIIMVGLHLYHFEVTLQMHIEKKSMKKKNLNTIFQSISNFKKSII